MGIDGIVLSKPIDVERISKSKKSLQIKKSINKLDIESYVNNGWQLVSDTKYKATVTKPKTKDLAFEDRIWLLFKDLGFDELNQDRKCELVYRAGIKKQVDVLARDNENEQTFVIDCAHSDNPGPIDARNKIKEWGGDYSDVHGAVKERWRFGRTNIIIILSSDEKRNLDIKLADDKKILLWSIRDVEYLEKLSKQCGPIARSQLYSFLFCNKKQNSLEKRCLALKGKLKSGTFYSFLISAKDLINYAYIHHRELHNISAASQAYQRMLQAGKLKEIKTYVDDIGGSFPNTIVVNFTKPIQWEKGGTSSGNVDMGWIRLPAYFGSAWIIDGQHRLYGAAMADSETLLPVLAFEGMNDKEQAELFVDINQKQTSVTGSLLWDLFSDIYVDSDDPKQKRQYEISEVAKRMHSTGPLKGLIDIPSMPTASKNIKKLKLNTVCVTIEKYSPWNIISPDDTSEKVIENIANIFNAYYETLKKLWLSDWEKAGDGVLLSNNGFGVFMMIFSDIIKHLAYKNKQNIFKSSNLGNFKSTLNDYLLLPIQEIDYKPALQKQIKSNSGRGGQNDNARIIDSVIKSVVPDFVPPRLEDFDDSFNLNKENSLEEKIKRAEKILRDHTLNQLEFAYGQKWWKKGLPGNLKARLDETWKNKIEKNPQLLSEKETNKYKFGELDLGGLFDVMAFSENWKEIFEDTFSNKNELKARILAASNLRAMYAHTKKFERQIYMDGASALNWLSSSIGISEIRPE